MTPAARAELRRLERALAYSAARSDVECYCHPEGEWTDCWYDPSAAINEEDREAVATALRYLDLRGLLERHPQGWVRVRDEA